jgi:hypothetical protein
LSSIFSHSIYAGKKLPFLNKILLVYRKEQFFRRKMAKVAEKMAKVAENGDRSIDPDAFQKQFVFFRARTLNLF